MQPQEFIQMIQAVGLGGAGWLIAFILYRRLDDLLKRHELLLEELREEEKARAEKAEMRLIDRVSNDTRPLVSEEWRRQLNERAKERERDKAPASTE